MPASAKSTQSSAALLKGRLRLLACVAAGALVLAFAQAVYIGGSLSLALLLLSLWGAGVSGLHWLSFPVDLPNGSSRSSGASRSSWLEWGSGWFFGKGGQRALLVVLLLAGWLLVAAFPPGPLRAEGTTLVDFFTVAWIFFAAVAWVVWSVCRMPQDAEIEICRLFSTPHGLCAVMLGAALWVAMGLQAALHVGREWASLLAGPLFFSVCFFVAETLLREVMGLFMPPSPSWGSKGSNGPNGANTTRVGASWVLEIWGAKGLAAMLQRFEEVTGTRLQETWFARAVLRAAGPLLFLAGILVWLGTAFTVVPLGHQGVRVHFGVFQEHPLPPGLRLSAPWPLGRVISLPTERLQEVSVGFVQDLQGPMFWSERHLAGELVFLVGEGSEILSINLPVVYRITDPVAYLRHTHDAKQIVAALAERHLLQGLTGRSLFALLTTDRDAVTQQVTEGMQRDFDRLQLGLSVVFVGLKDLHPALEVAPSYQSVAAAEDERESLIERARAFREEHLLLAQERAWRERTQAGTQGDQKQLLAEGQSTAFLALADVEKDPSAAALLRFRLWQEALERALPGREKILLPPGARVPVHLDLRPPSSSSAFP